MGGDTRMDDAALVRAIENLTDEIARYRKVKEGGIRLAEQIEADRQDYAKAFVEGR